MYRKRIHKFVIVFCFMFYSVTLYGCDNSKEETKDIPEETVISSESPTAISTELSSEEPESSVEEDGTSQDGQQNDEIEAQLDESKENVTELPIYCMTEDASDKESVMYQIDKGQEITSQLVVDCVVDEFANHNLEIGIDEVTESDGSVVVSFSSDKAPVTDVGAGVEGLILDCISQSLLDNVDSCEKVIFRIEGNAYESGHFAFGIDEAYDWK